MCGMAVPQLSRKKRRKEEYFKTLMRTKPSREIIGDATMLPWMRHTDQSHYGASRLEVLCDSELVVKWLLGSAKVETASRKRISSMEKWIYRTWESGVAMLRLPWSEVARHINGEHNELADEAAKNAFKQRGDFYTEHASFEKVCELFPST